MNCYTTTTSGNTAVSFMTMLIYLYHFFFLIAKKSIFRQLTPVWILPNLMYAILRFI